jgi:hypothetical protein
MALSPYGPHGPVIGKIGNLVSYILNGQFVTRTIGHKSNKHSKDQLANYQAMAVTMELLKPMTFFINSSFEIEARGTVKNQHNLATSYNKKQALTGEYPNIRVDYSKVVLSYGDLAIAENLKMIKTDTGLQISWDTEGGLAHDMVMVLVCHPQRGQVSSSINACRRDAGALFIKLPQEDLEQQLETYICFKSANGKQISNSVYLGNFNGEAETEQGKNEQKKYELVKARFDQVSADYLRMQELDRGSHTGTKAFRTLEKEYQVLKEKLERMPGKVRPG